MGYRFEVCNEFLGQLINSLQILSGDIASDGRSMQDVAETAAIASAFVYMQLQAAAEDRIDDRPLVYPSPQEHIA